MCGTWATLGASCCALSRSGPASGPNYAGAATPWRSPRPLTAHSRSATFVHTPAHAHPLPLPLAPSPARQDLAQAAAASPEVAAVVAGERPQLWLPDPAAMARAGAGPLAFVPRGAQSLLLQAVPGGGVLCVLCDRPRALPNKDRAWVAAMARKLA